MPQTICTTVIGCKKHYLWRKQLGTLGKCLSGEGEVHVSLKVSGSGKVKPSLIGSTLGKQGEQCVLTNLSKLKADVGQKAPGTLQFAIVSAP